MSQERKYVAYYRVSKDSHESGRSKAKGLGLEAQKNIVEHYFGNQIIEKFTETKSAKNIKDRPVLQKALQYCLDNNCWLAVAKLDRLSRNTIDVLSIIKNLNKKVSFCDIPSDGEADEFIITIFAAIAQRERELISLRTSQALRVKLARDGRWQRGNPDFINGNARKLAAKALRLKASSNENTIRASQIILDKHSQGIPFKTIASILNQNKFLSPNNSLFQTTQVIRIFNKISPSQ